MSCTRRGAAHQLRIGWTGRTRQNVTVTFRRRTGVAGSSCAIADLESMSSPAIAIGNATLAIR